MLRIFLLLLLFTCYIILLSYYMFMLEYHHNTRNTALQLYSTFVKSSSKMITCYMLTVTCQLSLFVMLSACVLAVGGGMTGACFGVWCGVVSRCVIVCGVLRWLIGMRMSGSCLMVYAGAVTSAFVRGTDALLQT